VGLDELAVQLNVSPSTFQRMVQETQFHDGMAKVIQIRMEQARTMLLNTDYPLKVISDKLGYADEFVFSNAFQKILRDFSKIL
jgi:AraC-like DNA-binding protein